MDWASVITAMTSVALRKESVDRNSFYAQKRHLAKQSLSARRAWIEIVFRGWTLNINGSLSARRAWIEIIDYIIDYVNDAVALRKESVDRNANTMLNT